MVALGVRVRPRDWNADRHEVRKGEPDWARLNEFVGQTVAAGRSALLDLQAAREPVTADALADGVRARLTPAAPPSEPADFLMFYRGVVRDYADHGQISTAKAHGSALNRLDAFTGGQLPFDRLTPALVQGWGRRMAAPAPHGEGLKQNYVRKLLTSVRTACRQAVRNGDAPAGWVDPFDRLKGDALLHTERVEKGRLTESQVRALGAAGAEPGSLVEVVRDAFVLAFYAGGMRFGDTALLRWADIAVDTGGSPVRIGYQAEKTKKPTSVPVVTEAGAVLARYVERAGAGGFVFPFLDGYDLSTPAKRRQAISTRNAYANKALKKLARRAELPDPAAVTFHVARHSLAAHLLDSGLGAHAIKEVLRHSSVQVTEKYLGGFDRGLLDEAYRDAFGGATAGKTLSAEGPAKPGKESLSVARGRRRSVRVSKRG
jgi:integrase